MQGKLNRYICVVVIVVVSSALLNINNAVADGTCSI